MPLAAASVMTMFGAIFYLPLFRDASKSSGNMRLGDIIIMREAGPRPARSALPDPEGGASVGYVIRFTITRRPPRSSPRRNPDAGRQQPQRAR